MKNYLEKLEYPKILNILSNYASTYLGKEKCLYLIPSNSTFILMGIKLSKP